MKYAVCSKPVTDHQNPRGGIAKDISTMKPDTLERTCVWLIFDWTWFVQQEVFMRELIEKNP
jgi:hypothetical protein